MARIDCRVRCSSPQPTTYSTASHTLTPAHVEGFAVHLTELHVRVADDEFAARIAHRGAAIAAAPRLMEHERTMLLAEHPDEVDREIGGEDLFGKVGHRGLDV